MATSKEPKKTKYSYVCTHCDKAYVNEAMFLEHVCTQMQRAQQMKTTEGMAAWIAYTTWMKLQGRKVPPQTSFIESKFYQSLIKFAGFVKTIPSLDMEDYIRHMIKLTMPPAIWTHGDVYKMYIKATKKESPIKQIQNSTMFIMKVCDEDDVPIDQFFANLPCPQLIQWIDNNDITPWILLVSTKFKRWYAGLDEDDQDRVNTAIDIDNWGTKIRNNPEVVQQSKDILLELGL